MYELQVKGMNCQHCVSSVTRSITDIDAGAKVEVDLATQKIRIESSATLDAIFAAVTDAGYPVTSSQAA